MKLIGLPFSKWLKKHFYSQKHAYHVQPEALSIVQKDDENVRQYALKVENIVEQGWYDEYLSTVNLKCKDSSTLPKKLKDFASKRQVKYFQAHLNPLFSFVFVVTWLTLKLLPSKEPKR